MTKKENFQKNNKAKTNRKSDKGQVQQAKKHSRIAIPTDCVKESVEYKTTEALAQIILNENKDKSKTPQEKLCAWVNENCGLKGYCTRVTYF